jgi:glyoxylase I family protein
VSVEVIGIDYIFVAVSDLQRSEGFYDRVMPVLGFRKGDGTIGGDPHLFYYNRQFVYSLRPARESAPDHDSYAPGLHHLCFRVVDETAVDRAVRELREAGWRPPSPATTRSMPQTTTRRSSRTRTV